MASLPPQRPQPRQAPSPPAQDSTDSSRSQQQDQHRRGGSPSAASVDSQTLLVAEGTRPSGTSQERPSPQAESHQPSHPTVDEGRKCWICFQDEEDDGPDASPWRTPCPCALTAHESCLLDWIGDMESPSASQTITAPKTIQCPQCKAEIHLQRPRSLIVQAAGGVEKALRSLLLPSAVLGTTYGLFLVSTHHGIWTIQQIFGAQDAQRILRPLFESPVVQRTRFDQLLNPRLGRQLDLINWSGLRLLTGLPMIPFALILSRTTLLDPVFPILPILFFATHSEHSADIASNIWPPSAAFTVAMLPYVRTLYDECLERVFGWREREWLKVIRPQLGNANEQQDQGQQGDAANNDGAQAGAAADDDDDVLQVEVDIEIDDSDSEADEAEGDAQPGPQAPQEQQAGDDAAPPPIARERDQAPDLHAPPQDAQRAQLRQDILDQLRQEHGNNNNNNNNRRRRNEGQQRRRNVNAGDLVLSASRLTEIVVGALAFPSICGLAGEALRFVLPASWVTQQSKIAPTGLLQTKWGRSIVGGCLMVMLKDAVRIYCRWKMAQAHKNRRVKNYDKKTGKVVEVGAAS